MNKPASSLTEQDFVRLPADRSMADAIVRPSVSYWRDVLRRIRSVSYTHLDVYKRQAK